MQVSTISDAQPFLTDIRTSGAALVLTGGVLLAACSTAAFPTTAAICAAVALSAFSTTLAVKLRRSDTTRQDLAFHACLLVATASCGAAVGLMGSLLIGKEALQVMGLFFTVIGGYSVIFNTKYDQGSNESRNNS